MSEAGMPWVKLFTEIIDDSKVGKLTDVVKWRYVSLIALAGECDAEGFLVNGNDAMSIQDIAWRLRLPASKLAQEFEKISEQGLIDTVDGVWRVTKFSERQGRSQSDRREQWKARKAKQRQKTEGLEWSSLETPDSVTPDVTRDSSVTPAHVTRLEGEGEESRGREEKNKGADAPPPKQKPEKAGTHPAVAKFREKAKAFPAKGQYEAIEKAVGADPAHLERWGQTVEAYILMGWSPRNISGMLDFFKRNELPGRKDKLNGTHNPLPASKPVGELTQAQRIARQLSGK